MKRVFTIFLSLIFVLCFFAPVFADQQVFILDPYSGEVIIGNDNKGNTSTTSYADITSSCRYDKTRGLYILNFSGDSRNDIALSVYKGMITTDPVKLTVGSLANVTVYCDGEVIPEDQYISMTRKGSYVITDNTKQQEVARFVIINSLTSLLKNYTIPSVFTISKVTLNGEMVTTIGNDVDLSEEGHYVIQYGNDNAGKYYTLTLDIDHTAPQLVVSGVVDGVAKSAVSFGELEPESSFRVVKDGTEINFTSGELKDAGNYVVYYSDKAGNTVTFAFTIRVFFDEAAWIYVGLIGAIIIGAIVYLIYSRKNLRTC